MTERTFAQYRGTVLLDGNRLFGTLTITRGQLVLEADDSRVNRLVRMWPSRPVAQTEPVVEVMQTRLMWPPWFNTTVFVREGLRVGVANYNGWFRRPLVADLVAFGFEVKQTRSWFSLGGDRHR